MKKYALLYFTQINDKFSKWIFPLHEGENIIGSDKDVDIFLYLNQRQDKIEPVHCKINVKEYHNKVGIINLASNGYVKRGENKEAIILSPGKEYELKNKNIFYLTENIKFMLIKGTIEEIHDFCLDENLESEFQKWKIYISAHENNMKVNLNLTRKESYNKSFVSNNNDTNNNNNLNNSINNNNIAFYNNSASPKKNNLLNSSLLNSLINSNNKEINRMGFNNFDEVPEDNLIIDYKSSQNNIINASGLNKTQMILNNSNLNNSTSNYNKNIDNNNINPINNNNDSKIQNLTHIKKQLSTDITFNNNNIISEKESEKKSLGSHSKKEIINNEKKNKGKEADKDNRKENIINTNSNEKSKKNNNYYYNNSLDLFKQTSSEYKSNNIYNEKEVIQDEKTIQTIRELLGEDDLEIIYNNTNYKDIKKYDIIYKKNKNKTKNKSGVGNFDIKVKNNDFLNQKIKPANKYKNRYNK